MMTSHRLMVVPLTLELLTPTSLPALLLLEHDGQPHPWSEAQLRQSLEDEQTYVWGAIESDDLQGFAVISRLPFDAELQAITVSPRARRRGIASSLLAEGIAQARRWASERILLEVRVSNEAAIGLYEKAGFVRDGVRRDYYGNAGTKREDALLMSLSLEAGKA